ncbi:MAG: M24 family metallopeptidase, partial [Candidatus Magasanikbacteria bacterium]|nr:M24 family metallopeptidase [Candidatus Magasanikbacteria bacterium]
MLIKSKKDIEILKEGGVIIGQILSNLAQICVAGKSTWEIDKIAEEMIIKVGGMPAFKHYQSDPKDIPFPSTICACLNEQIVHAIASKDVVLKNGDIFTIDIGMDWPCFAEATPGKPLKVKSKGMITDTSITVAIGEIDQKVKELMRVTKQSLEEGIKAVKPGNSVADIGRAIENYVKSQGKYGIVRELVGHGVGHHVHEDPIIPNYYDRKMENFILKPGMVLAIEPMIALGHWKVKDGPDGFSIIMADGSFCAHYEHTVVVTEKGCD